MGILKTVPNASTLEQFIGLGAVREERDVFGNKIVMQTLTTSVLGSIAVQCSGLDVYARDRVMKIEILSRAIKSIGSQSLIVDDVDDEKQTKSEVIDRVKKTIGKWEDQLLETAFDEYRDLVRVQNEFFEDLKKKYKKKIETS